MSENWYLDENGNMISEQDARDLARIKELEQEKEQLMASLAEMDRAEGASTFSPNQGNYPRAITVNFQQPKPESGFFVKFLSICFWGVFFFFGIIFVLGMMVD